MARTRGKVFAGAEVTPEIMNDLDALAVRWSRELGEVVSRSAVIQALLEESVHRHTVSEEERTAAQAGEVSRPGPSRHRPRLRLVAGSPVLTTIADEVGEERRRRDAPR